MRDEASGTKSQESGTGIQQQPRPAPGSRQLAPRRHHWIVRLTHWATFVVLAGLVTSGLQIYVAYARFGERGGPYWSPNPFQDAQFPEWARLGGWLAGALNWHFALMWPLVACGLLYLFYLVRSGEWRSLWFRPRDVPGAWQMARYYLRLRREHPPQGKHNPLQKLAYSSIVVLGAVAVLSGLAIYKPVQLAWLVAAFGGFQLARFFHFWTVWIFVAFSVVHVTLVFVVDPPSLRAMLTGRYRGRFPSHD
jgi:thiosulfate reductase cytochrome b subunit